MESTTSYELTTRDRLTAQGLKWGPWLAPIVFSVPLPLIFLILLFVAASNPAAAVSFLFFAALTFGVGLIAGLITTMVLLAYRTSWLKKLRDKLARDGVTAGELEWFMAELSTSERKALREMERQDPLLGDAYRETLASRITATRVTASAKKELRLVERRVNKVMYLQGADTTKLREELAEDRVRLRKIQDEAVERRVEAQARLEQIEAEARRGISVAHTDIALKRLNASRDQLPLALESAKIEREIRDEIDREAARIRGEESLFNDLDESADDGPNDDPNDSPVDETDNRDRPAPSLTGSDSRP
jgi:hypothetical protein